MTIGVAIPAYKNAVSLRRCLAAIYAQFGADFTPVVVVDDSGDGQVAGELREIFPHVKWLIHDANRGFGPSASEAVLSTACDVSILLNDDTELLTDCRNELSIAFADPMLFAVSFQSVNAQDEFREGAKRIVWRCGMPKVLHNPADQYPVTSGMQRSDYAVGGHCAYRRLQFAEVGGFDEHFAPYYWEDVDLCFRAETRGWRVVYLPAARVRHAGASAIRTHHAEAAIRAVIWRNRLRFARRHACGIQRALLPLARIYLRVQACVGRNRALAQALCNA
jgi:GT2 family glycosyltransferase